MTAAPADPPLRRECSYEIPREFFGQRFVYTVISPRAEGLAIGVSLNPDRCCNLDCAYCEVEKSGEARRDELDLETVRRELEQTIRRVRSSDLRQHPSYKRLPEKLLILKHVALSGNGEPTLSDQFKEITETVMQVRAQQKQFFKIVLVTNGTALDRREVQEAVSLFTLRDEVWIKLDPGTEEYAKKVNGNTVGLRKILSNILQLGRKRPVVIQSLFSAIDGERPSPEELFAYRRRLHDLRQRGADIQLVQVYSARRPPRKSRCSPLTLPELSAIANDIRMRTGLNARVF